MEEDKHLPNNLEELRRIQSSDTLFKIIMKDSENIKMFLETLEPNLSKHLDFDTIKVLDTEKYNLKENKKTHLDLAFEISIKDSKEKLDIYFIFEHKSKPDKAIFLQLLSYIYARFEEVHRAVEPYFTSWVDKRTGTGSVRNAKHRAMESHFTSWVDKRTGTGSVRNAKHRAVEPYFTSWVDKRTGTGSVRNAKHTRNIKTFPYIIPVVVYVGKDKWNIPISNVENEPINDEIKKYLFELKYLLKTPEDITIEQLESIKHDIDLYAYFTLIKMISGEIPIEIGLENILFLIKDKETKALFLIEVYKNLDIDFQEFRDILFKLPSGGKEVKNLFEDAINYGKIEGKIEAKIEAIIDILSIRFPTSDLSSINTKLQHIDDIEFLDSLKQKAKTIVSIDEFEYILDRI